MIRQMLPEEFKQRIGAQEYIDSEALIKALDEPSPVSIRINPSKWNKKPLNAESVPWCRNGYYLDTRPSFTLDPLFHSGCYYPQEASGMFLEQVVNQAAGSLNNIRVLDLCGAPGGKSTHLSEIIGPDSLLVANETIRARAVILAETMTKWGSGNTLVTRNDPSVFARIPGYFDLIVVDAPCSGEGMFRTNSAVSEWSAENSIHCAERQKRILTDVWPALKENGILIYCTCTFNPGENEENIKWLTGKHGAESIRVEVGTFNGIKEIDYRGIYGYGFFPGKVRGEGFFISVVRKSCKKEEQSVRTRRIPGLKPGKTDIKVTSGWTDFPESRILRWGSEIFAIPCDLNDYLYLFQNLKVIKAGTKISVVKNNDHLPSHELALSHKFKTDSFPRVELNLSEAVSYMRRDNFTNRDIPEGWNILTYRNINVGFVNNVGRRVNNYFPVEWRIRLDASVLAQTPPITWL